MKKVLLITLLCVISIAMNAQWKVTSTAPSQGQNKCTLYQILETGNSVCIYANYKLGEGLKQQAYTINRKTYVLVDGQKYKILNSVNFPLSENDENRNVYFEKPGDNVNFVMEFEKFPVKDGFCIIEDDAKENSLNVNDIHIKQINTSELLDTKRFLDCDLTFWGQYYTNGNAHSYFIHEGVMVDVGCVKEEDPIFYINIVNNSNHSVRFDFDKVIIDPYKEKSTGVEHYPGIKYTPESYDQYRSQMRYNNAKNSVTSDSQRQIRDKADMESRNSNNSEWARIGYSALTEILDHQQENSINRYLKEHPDDSPKALRTQDIPSGHSVYGYIAMRNKHYSGAFIRINMDNFEYYSNWGLK